MSPDPVHPYQRVLVHYAEIGTKGGNRPVFERRLARNLDRAARGSGAGRFGREQGRLSADIRNVGELEPLLVALSKVPGVAWLAPARKLEPDIDAISAAVVSMATAHPDSVFRVDARRTDKTFPMDSLAVNRAVGAAVVEATGRRVSLGHPDYSYGVLIGTSSAHVYWDRRAGPGGLPVGIEGALVALLSGGIDSPVAAYRMIVRGCTVHLVHFLNRSVSANRVVDKVRDLGGVLAGYHGPIDLSIVPFEGLQREIVMVVPAKYRMIVYRRAMFAIADRIRAEIGGLGFVTGDSVGQVASQTLENLAVIYAAAGMPVYAPLAGMSKLDITDLAKKIGTYEISIRPHEDCCSFMVAKHPETRADLESIRAAEKFDLEAGVAEALAGRERLTLDESECVR